jgi:tRNA (mo5U34)-methyltransferase
MGDDLATEISRYYWWHSIDLGTGIVTPGQKTPEQHVEECHNYFDAIDLCGKSVLDIGAWNGFYSFEAKRRGASRVVATDCFTWSHPIFQGRKSFEFARAALDMDVQAIEIDVAEMTADKLGSFDVVLFLGVLYHLPNPIDGLQRVAALANELLVVETMLDFQDIGRPAMAYYHDNDPKNDLSNFWWAPNVACLVTLLRGHGFPVIDCAIYEERRGVFHAWRSTAARRCEPPRHAAVRAHGPSTRRLRQLSEGLRLIRRGLGLP